MQNEKETEILEFGTPRENEERRDGGCAVVFDPQTQKYAVGEQNDGGEWHGALRLFSGGVDPDEDMQAGILREVTEESGLYQFGHVEKVAEAISHYYNSLKDVNRVAYAACLLVILEGNDTKPTALEEHEKFHLVWVTADELLENLKSRNHNKDYDHWLYFIDKAVSRAIELGYDTTTDSNILK